MRPSVVLLGFVLGSTASITFGLFGIVLVFLLLRSEYPQLRGEFPFLVTSLGVFLALTVLAALSFYGQLRETVWRRAPVAALLISLLAVGWWYWPR